MVVDDQGLNVPDVVCAGGSVADVAHRDVALAEGSDPFRTEYLADQTDIPVRGENAVAVQGNTGALLAPVLQGVKPKIDQGRKLEGLWSVDSEYAALFAKVAGGNRITRHVRKDGA
jgi:hypothetical protein